VEVPGPRITRDDEPRLFEVLDVVAREMDAPLPDEVYLVADVNIVVAELGRFFAGPRRILAMGLGLLSLYSRVQLRSALAHEFAHAVAGDYHQGPLTTMAKLALLRASQGAQQGGLTAHISSMITGAIGPTTHAWHARSREAELHADLRAVAIYGSAVHTESVVRGVLGSALFEQYIAREVQPLVALGYRPARLVDGFTQFVENEHELGLADRSLRFLRGLDTHALDTHPALTDRIRALFAGGERAATVDDTEASTRVSTLVSDLERRDREVTDAWAKVQRLAAHTPIEWHDVGERALLPGIRANASGLAEVVRARLAVAGSDDDTLSLVVERVRSEGRASLEPLFEELAPRLYGFDDPLVALTGMLLTGALLARGAALVYVPGIPMRLTTTRGPIDPFRVVADAHGEGGDPALVTTVQEILASSTTAHPS